MQSKVIPLNIEKEWGTKIINEQVTIGKIQRIPLKNKAGINLSREKINNIDIKTVTLQNIKFVKAGLSRFKWRLDSRIDKIEKVVNPVENKAYKMKAQASWNFLDC